MWDIWSFFSIVIIYFYIIFFLLSCHCNIFTKNNVTYMWLINKLIQLMVLLFILNSVVWKNRRYHLVCFYFFHKMGSGEFHINVWSLGGLQIINLSTKSNILTIPSLRARENLNIKPGLDQTNKDIERYKILFLFAL